MKDEDKTKDQLREEPKKKQRELEAKIAELEQFTYTIAHDLTNPLITILLLTLVMHLSILNKILNGSAHIVSPGLTLIW